MKLRYGFVSNSSSSSFLVVFPHQPADVTDLQQMMFGDVTEWQTDDEPKYSHTLTTGEIARRVWQEIVPGAKVARRIGALEEKMLWGTLMHTEGVNRTCVDRYYPLSWKVMDEFKQKVKKDANVWDLYEHRGWSTRYYDAQNQDEANMQEQEKQIMHETAKRLLEYDGVIYEFSFSDNDGELESDMEHGKVFDNLPHVRISHH